MFSSFIIGRDMKKVLLLLFVSVIFFTSRYAFAQGDVHIKPFQFTLFPPISTNGLDAPHAVNHVSFNAFVGLAAGVDGVEFGGFFNIESEFVKGIQYAGFGNLNAGYIDALQFSGFVNINKEGGRAIQGAGFTNLNWGDMEAIELAGFFNSSKDLKGAQASGFVNVANRVEGAQAAGFVNLSDDLLGAQVAGFTNIAKDVNGVQGSGFLNIAENVKGVQVAGFVNICDSIDGIPVAFLSIVRKNGYRKIEVYSDEVFYINTSFKIGVEKFYTVYSLGIRPVANDIYYTYGYGFGTNITIDEAKSCAFEYHFQQIVDNDYEDYAYEHTLNRLKICFHYQLSDHMGLFAGPTFNMLTTQYPDYTENAAPSWAFYLWDGKYNKVEGWFGFNLGFRFL